LYFQITINISCIAAKLGDTIDKNKLAKRRESMNKIEEWYDEKYDEWESLLPT